MAQQQVSGKKQQGIQNSIHYSNVRDLNADNVSELQMQYSNFKDTLQNIASQIGNVEQEVEEHKYVEPTFSSVVSPSHWCKISVPPHAIQYCTHGIWPTCFEMNRKNTPTTIKVAQYQKQLASRVGYDNGLALNLCCNLTPLLPLVHTTSLCNIP